MNLEAWGREVADPPFEVVDGYIALPDTPGLGIDLDESALARFPLRAVPRPPDSRAARRRAVRRQANPLWTNGRTAEVRGTWIGASAAPSVARRHSRGDVRALNL